MADGYREEGISRAQAGGDGGGCVSDSPNDLKESLNNLESMKFEPLSNGVVAPLL